MMDSAGDQLGSAARALLDAARDGLAPDAAAVRRVRAKVGASAAGAGAALALKLGLLGVVAVLAISAGVYASRARTADSPSIALPARIETAPIAGSATRTDTAPAPAARTDAAPIEMAPQSARPHAIDLAREVALIDSAMAALKAGDPDGALAAIHAHAREARGAGQLAEDAAAIEIEALCRLHDPTTAAKLDAFDVRFPRSAQRSRLTTVCP